MNEFKFCIGSCYSKCDPQALSISIIWKFALTPDQMNQNLHFNKSLFDSNACKSLTNSGQDQLLQTYLPQLTIRNKFYIETQIVCTHTRNKSL
uniref:Uncharacterized protein n=1 Tax=Macaca fascicularis TaxID=9541 RepID=Q9GMK0_MACFA|nr:hypothetical protein [Macaca fascicularis]